MIKFHFIFCFFLSVLQAISIQELIDSKNCTTNGMGGLTSQLVYILNTSTSNLFSIIEASDHLNLSKSVQNVPLLQTEGYKNLLQAINKSNQTMYMNSALRLVPQQLALYKWYLMGLCGITLAYKPGNSSHESGLAIDIRNYTDWIDILKDYGWIWMGKTDLVHFTYENGTSLNNLNVKSFQKLWNCNNPYDLLEENGIFDKQTEDKMLDSPIEGFPSLCNENILKI